MVLNPSIESFMSIRQDTSGKLVKRSFIGPKDDLIEVYNKRRTDVSRRQNVVRAQDLPKLSLLQNIVAFNASISQKSAKNK